MTKIYLTTGINKFDYALKALDNHLALSSKSISTRKMYCRSLRLFTIKLNKLPEECTKIEIVNYLMDCKTERNLHYSSLKGYMYGMKYYLKYIAERMDLFEKIPNPVIKPYDINVLNIEEINLMISKCKNIRELLIIQILYETGMRVGELVRLTMNDFDFHNNTVTILNSKNRKTRTINFGNKLKDTINLYLDNFKSLFSGTLLARQYHPFMPISNRGITWVIKALVKRSGITKRVNLHSFRHTFAVHYLNFGGTIYQLQKLLGHCHLMTTIHYLQYAVLPESRHISILDKILELGLKESSKTNEAKDVGKDKTNDKEPCLSEIRPIAVDTPQLAFF